MRFAVGDVLVTHVTGSWKIEASLDVPDPRALVALRQVDKASPGALVVQTQREVLQGCLNGLFRDVQLGPRTV